MNEYRGHTSHPQPFLEEPAPVRARPKIDPTTKNRLATEEEVRLAGRVLQDLSLHRLSVVLVPAPSPSFEGHKVRAVETENPEWYQDFIKEKRDGLHIVKRKRILTAMKRVYEKGIIRSNGYEVQILPHVAKYPEKREW